MQDTMLIHFTLPCGVNCKSEEGSHSKFLQYKAKREGQFGGLVGGTVTWKLPERRIFFFYIILIPTLKAICAKFKTKESHKKSKGNNHPHGKKVIFLWNKRMKRKPKKYVSVFCVLDKHWSIHRLTKYRFIWSYYMLLIYAVQFTAQYVTPHKQSSWINWSLLRAGI